VETAGRTVHSGLGLGVGTKVGSREESTELNVDREEGLSVSAVSCSGIVMIGRVFSTGDQSWLHGSGTGAKMKSKLFSSCSMAAIIGIRLIVDSVARASLTYDRAVLAKDQTDTMALLDWVALRFSSCVRYCRDIAEKTTHLQGSLYARPHSERR
jgi:hypothetical protein